MKKQNQTSLRAIDSGPVGNTTGTHTDSLELRNDVGLKLFDVFLPNALLFNGIAAMLNNKNFTVAS